MDKINGLSSSSSGVYRKRDPQSSTLYRYVEPPFGEYVNLRKISPSDLAFKFPAIMESRSHLSDVEKYIDFQN